MNKEQFKQKTIEVINDLHARYIETLETVVNNLDDEHFAEYEDNYSAPKDFYEALTAMIGEKVTEQSYGVSYTRKHHKIVRQFERDIMYNRVPQLQNVVF